MGILLIGDGYFYIGRVIIITVFPWQFFVITLSYVVLLQKAQKQPLEVFCKRTCSQNRLQHRCFLVKLTKFLRTFIFKNICERLLLQDITEKKLHLFLSQNYQDFVIITITFQALKFLLPFCAVIVFDNLFYENIFSFLLCQLSSSELTDY